MEAPGHGRHLVSPIIPETEPGSIYEHWALTRHRPVPVLKYNMLALLEPRCNKKETITIHIGTYEIRGSFRANSEALDPQVLKREVK